MAKPEPEIYLAVNEQINEGLDEKPEVFFVDDIAANREAAEKTVGWTTYPDIQTLLETTYL